MINSNKGSGAATYRTATTTSRLIIAIAAIAMTVCAIAQGTGALTNADIIKMSQAGLAPTIIVSTIKSAPSVQFDLSADGLVALRRAGVSDVAINALILKARPVSQTPVVAQIDAPEKSQMLNTTKNDATILRNFKTVLINASQASFFDDQAVKVALSNNKDFKNLNIIVVDDPKVADVVLEISYVFAWDYPFTLKHSNSSMVLVSGKGYGAFSGSAGAASVADELVKALKPYRPK